MSAQPLTSSVQGQPHMLAHPERALLDMPMEILLCIAKYVNEDEDAHSYEPRVYEVGEEGPGKFWEVLRGR